LAILVAVRTIVQKYGGSSVADVAKLRFVAERAMRAKQAGMSVVVVVSAMGDTTDELLGMAKQVSPNPDRRELDMLLSAGERISMALLSMAVRELGGSAISFTGSQSGIITDDRHVEARIVDVRPMRVQAELAQGRIVVVAGYQGVSGQKEVTTLGRGGSDTTAVAMAAALDAEYCEICSDVDGVYTADPRVVPSARRIPTLSYEETQEMAVAGARVLNARAVEFARAKGIAIYARATAGPLPGPDPSLDGTVVSGQPSHLPGHAVGVASESNVLAIETDATQAVVQQFWSDRGVPDPGLFVPGERTRLVLSRENLHDEDRLRTDLEASLGATTRLTSGLASVSVVGQGLGSDAVRMGREALAASDVAAFGFAARPLRLVWLVPQSNAHGAVRALHARFIEGRDR
jgi:aspartate kinase